MKKCNKKRSKNKFLLPNQEEFLYDINCEKNKKGVCLMNNTIPENRNTFKELEKKITHVPVKVHEKLQRQ